MSDDWGDIDEETRMGRRIAAARRQSVTTGPTGRSREQRFLLTLAAVAALMLVIGLSVGFAIGIAAGRRQAPQPVAQVTDEPTETPEATVTPVVETTPAPAVEESVSVVATSPPEAPETPGQTAPDDGDRINADRVMLRWSKVPDVGGEPVTYAFEIQTRVNGVWGQTQVIDELKTPSYSARVLQARRRWRVWAVAADGTESEKSGWSEYAHTPVIKTAPKSTTPSTTPSSTTPPSTSATPAG